MNTAATQDQRRIIKSRPDFDYRQSARDLALSLLERMNKQMAVCVSACGGPDHAYASAKLAKIVRIHGKAVKRSVKITDRALTFQDYQMRWCMP